MMDKLIKLLSDFEYSFSPISSKKASGIIVYIHNIEFEELEKYKSKIANTLKKYVYVFKSEEELSHFQDILESDLTIYEHQNIGFIALDKMLKDGIAKATKSGTLLNLVKG